MSSPNDTVDEASATAAPEGRDRGTVLLLGGHGGLRVDVRRRLAARYRVLEAAGATPGLAIARRHQPDLVIRSAGTPAPDGYVPCPVLAAEIPALSADDQVFLRRVEELIMTHLDDDEFDTGVLVRQLATSRTNLYHRLRRLTGRAPAALIMERRLRRAAEWLAEGGYSVSEVAYGVGFKSVSHFSRRFEQHHGVRPSALLEGNSRS